MSTAKETEVGKKEQVKEVKAATGAKTAKTGRKKAESATKTKKTTRTKASSAKKTTKGSSAKKTGTAAKAKTGKTTTKKATTTKKTTRKATGRKKTTDAGKNINVVIQFAGNDISVNKIVASVSKAAYDSAKKEIGIFIQPDNGVAYYTVDGNGGDDFKVEI